MPAPLLSLRAIELSFAAFHISMSLNTAVLSDVSGIVGK
jgi:hypothetical protein